MVKYREEELFKALGQPVRLRMVERLSKEGRLSVSRLGAHLNITLPAVLKHTRVLEASGVVVCSKEGRVQYCRLNPAAFEEMVGWLLFHKQFWSTSFSRLEQHITNRKKK